MSANGPAADLVAPIEWGEVEEARVSTQTFALKDQDTFLVGDVYGDVVAATDGLFDEDTRIGALPARIGGWKKRSDVACRHGSQ